MGCKDLDHKPRVSIVTVVFNAEAEVERTLQSVLNQSYSNIEYIVIDGKSTDGTLAIIEKYADRIDHIISEEDEGIYDAMNKGARIASGVWVNFMNAGDAFYDNHTVARVFDSKRELSDYDFIYGDYYWHNADKASFLIKARPLDSMWQRISFAHQSLFTKNDVLRAKPFDTSFKIVSDYEHYYSCYNQGYKFYYADTPVSVFSSGGLSDQNFLLRTYERCKVVLRYEPAWKVLRHYFRLVVEHYFYTKNKNVSSQSFNHTDNLVSVIVPNYNNREYLQDCIESILKQTYSNFEIIFVDDLSTDDSVDVVRQYGDDRIRIFKNSKNMGIAATRNRGISEALGKYVTTLDSDDVLWDTTKIEKEMELIAYHRKKWNKDIVAFSNVVFIDKAGAGYQMVGKGNIKEGDIFEGILARNIFIPRDYTCHKRLIVQAGGYDERIPLYEDWDLKLRLAKDNEYHYTGIAGIGYRRHGQGLSAAPEPEHEYWRSYIAAKNSASC